MASKENLIAIVNAGSATLKFSLLGAGDAVLRVLIERLGETDGARPRAIIKDSSGVVGFDGPIPARNHEDGLAWLFDWIGQERPDLRLAAVGHRVVHGGDSLQRPVLVTPEVTDLIESLVHLAPLHQPHNLSPIRFIAHQLPELPQVACFDTAFHASQSKIERIFALPRWWSDRGIKRYGFHGLSYEYIASCLPGIDERAATGRTVVCHLGNGASLCGLRSGRSVATTMAFTALEGLPMGTRCGSIDPGVLLYLLDQENMSTGELSDLLYKRSGLLGISGISSDMRDLLADPGEEAAEAVEYFCYRIARDIGSLVAALGGLDALVFTGGIGEHATPVRARVCELSQWLGIAIDPVANADDLTILHTADSAIKVLIVPTNEERMMAKHVAQVLAMDEWFHL